MARRSWTPQSRTKLSDSLKVNGGQPERARHGKTKNLRTRRKRMKTRKQTEETSRRKNVKVS
jgi:hypothetical protein